MHRIAKRLREFLRYPPLVLTLPCFHYRAHTIDASFRIDERAVLFEKRRAGQKYMSKLGGFVEKQVLYDEAFHIAKCCLDMMRVGV